MRSMRKISLAFGIAALSVFAVLPANPAAASTQYVVTTPNLSVYQSTLHCYSASNCNVKTSNGIYDYLVMTPGPNRVATVDYAAVNGTAVAGRDFTGVTSGRANFGAYGGTNEVAPFNSPLSTTNDDSINDTRTFTVHLSNPSIPADVSAVSTVTIYPHAQIPSDCTFTADTEVSLSLTCTNRPAAQHWHFTLWCVSGWTSHNQDGNTVQGDGTSTVNCGAIADSHADTGTFTVTS